jgi:hypothetical protein
MNHEPRASALGWYDAGLWPEGPPRFALLMAPSILAAVSLAAWALR